MLSVNGINFAIRDFMLDEDTDVWVFDENGKPSVRTLPKWKRFFTYNEIISLQYEKKFPKGLRLPTISELMALSYMVTVDELIDKFGFSFGGYIESYNMEKYNEEAHAYYNLVDPRGKNLNTIAEIGDSCYYWSSNLVTCEPTYAYSLEFTRRGPSKYNALKQRCSIGHGFSVRLIAD